MRDVASRCLFEREIVFVFVDMMKEEISCAAQFVSSLLRERHSAPERDKVVRFTNKLQELLRERFHDHWHPEKPLRGSAFRCIRINHKLDPVVEQALLLSGLRPGAVQLPSELSVWIDPYEVSYRIGEDGSICQLMAINCSN